MATSTVDLLGAIHTHLADFELPDMWSVQVGGWAGHGLDRR